MTTIWKAAAGWMAGNPWSDVAHLGAGKVLLYNNFQ